MIPEAVQALRAELDRAREAGRVIEMWWRDDDAVRATPALDRLLGLARSYRVPLAIAAIPMRVEPSLVARLDRGDDVRVLPHGYAHANHAPAGDPKAEFGAHRPPGLMADEIATGWRRLRGTFGERALGVFVPPWNRVAPELRARLGDLDLVGCSAFGPAPSPDLNTHLDPVAWRTDRSLAPAADIAAMLARNVAGGATRIGYLSHHLDFDEALWRFTEGLLELATTHSAVRFRTLESLIWPSHRRRETVRQTTALRRTAGCLS